MNHCVFPCEVSNHDGIILLPNELAEQETQIGGEHTVDVSSYFLARLVIPRWELEPRFLLTAFLLCVKVMVEQKTVPKTMLGPGKLCGHEGDPSCLLRKQTKKNHRK